MIYANECDAEREDLTYEVRTSWAQEHAPELLDSSGEAIDWDALCEAFDAFDWRAEIAKDEDAAWAEWSGCPTCGDPIDYCAGHGNFDEWEVF